jgi:hypothetical protein
VSPIELTSITTLELAVVLLAAFLVLTLLAALTTLLAALTTLLVALLTLTAASFLSAFSTPWSLLPATLILLTIVFHDHSSRVRNVNCFVQAHFKLRAKGSILVGNGRERVFGLIAS